MSPASTKIHGNAVADRLASRSGASNDEIERPGAPAPAKESSGSDMKQSFTSIQLLTPTTRDGDPDGQPTKSSSLPHHARSHKWRTRFEGWRMGASVAASLALMSLLINFAVVVWLGSKSTASTLVSVYEGSCSTVAQMDIWVHLAINIVSTLLLGGSNYCMQCVCAPTRPEINRSHAEGRYLDIGVLSVRNLSAIPRSKKALWCALGFSSLPLHLMYNSTFFKSLVATDYNMLLVTEDFVNGATFSNAWYAEQRSNATSLYGSGPHLFVNAELIQDNLSKYIRLEPTECIGTYAKDFVSKQRNLVLVANKETLDPEPPWSNIAGHYGISRAANLTDRIQDPLLLQDYNEFGLAKNLRFEWICTSVPRAPWALNATFGKVYHFCENYYQGWLPQIENWKPYGQDIMYCLSEPIGERCAYIGSIPIISVVIVGNAIKLVCMYVVATRLRDNPLITVGDALETFLEEPDLTPKGMCLATRQDFITNGTGVSYRKTSLDTARIRLRGRCARLSSRTWRHAASPLRWTLTIGLLIAAVIICCVLTGKMAYTCASV